MMTPNPFPPPSQPPPQQPPQKQGGKSAVTIILLIVGALFLCCVLGIIVAIAVPNFLKFQARSKQSECKVNLKSIYVGQMAWFGEKSDYADTFADVAFNPMSPRRYSYFMGEQAQLPATTGAAVTETDLPEIAGGQLPGVYGECPDDCEFVAVCAGNVDNDPTLDVWSVSSKAREKNGMTIAPGEVFHDQDDAVE